MSRVLTKLVSQNRVKELLGCYGGSPESWPEDERSSALSLLEGSVNLRDLRDQESQLDRVMQVHKEVTEESDRQSVAALMNRIVENLPPQEKWIAGKHDIESGEQIKTTLSHRNKFFFGSIAASFIVIVSMVLMNYAPLQIDTHAPYQTANLGEESLGKIAFNRWAWDEAIGENLDDDYDYDDESEESEFSLYTLAELEA